MTRILLLGVSLLVCLCSTVALAAHGVWHDHYSSAAGTPCCRAQDDCHVAQVRVLEQTATQVRVEVNGVVIEIPAKSLHASEDAQAYVCVIPGTQPIKAVNIRCVFFAVGA